MNSVPQSMSPSISTIARIAELRTKRVYEERAACEQLLVKATNAHTAFLYQLRIDYCNVLLSQVSSKERPAAVVQQRAAQIIKIMESLVSYVVSHQEVFKQQGALPNLERLFANNFLSIFFKTFSSNTDYDLDRADRRKIIDDFFVSDRHWRDFTGAIKLLGMEAVLEEAIEGFFIPPHRARAYRSDSSHEQPRVTIVDDDMVVTVTDHPERSATRAEKNAALEQEAQTKAQKDALRLYSQFQDFQGELARNLTGNVSPYARPVDIYTALFPILNRHYREFDVALRTEMKGLVLRLISFDALDTTTMQDIAPDVLRSAYKDTQRHIMRHFKTDTCHHFFEVIHKFDLTEFYDKGCAEGLVHKSVSKEYDKWKRMPRRWTDRSSSPLNVTVKQVPVVRAAPLPVLTAPPRSAQGAAATAVKPAAVQPVDHKPAPAAKGFKAKGWDLEAPQPIKAVPLVVTIVKPAVPVANIVDEPVKIELAEDVVPEPVIVEAAVEVVAEPAQLEETSLVVPVVARLNIHVSDQDARDDVSDKGKQEKRSSAGSKHNPHDRTGLLEKALVSDRVEGKIITPYMQPVDPQNVDDRLYNVIDIEFPKNDQGVIEYAQILICNFHGRATFIRRDTGAAFDPDDEISINALRDDVKVWMVPFDTDEQWVEGVQMRLYTKVDEMEIQLKSDHYWKGRGWALIDEFAKSIVRTGKYPDANDTTVFTEGWLKGEATPCAAMAALRRGTAEGLREFRTPKALLSHLEQSSMPGLTQFKTKGRQVRVPAQDVYLAVAKGEEGDHIAGWSLGVLKLAFRYGAVEHLVAVLPGVDALPRTFEDFADLVRKRTKAWRNQPE